MGGFLRTAFAVMGLGVALSSVSLQAGEACCAANEPCYLASEPGCAAAEPCCAANEPSCCLSDCVEAASQPCNQCNECATCDCCECGDCCDKSAWYGYAGAIFLTRDGSNAGTIIGPNPPVAGTAFLNGTNFNFDNQSGYDTTIGRRFASGNAIEARYFGVDDVFATSTIVTPGNFIGVGFTGPGGTTAVSRYWTQLKSIEANYKYALGDRLSVLGGFRYVQLNDTLRTTLNNNVATGLYEFQNDLYGGQVGLDLLLTDPAKALELRVVGKAGWYQNDYSGGIREFQGNNPIGSFLGIDQGTSFVGDLVFSGSYWINEHVALRGGYQLLWVGDVALAGDEAARSQLNPALLRTPKHDGDVFMHGALVGIEFMW